jgi:biopolymer transport protein ExbD
MPIERSNWPAAFLTLIFAAATTQAAPQVPRAYIRVAKSHICYIADVRVSCNAIVKKLKEMQVDPADRIEVMGDPHVDPKRVSEVTDLLKAAGYQNVLAFCEK